MITHTPNPTRASSAILFLSTFILFFTTTLPSHATILTNTSSFGPTTIIESFENIANPAANLPMTSPLTLPSGAIISQTTTPNSVSLFPHVVDGGFFGLISPSPLIPDGTSYLGQGNPSLFDDGITIQLPALSFRAGAFIATQSSDNGVIRISALNESGGIIESTTTTGIPAENWASNFVGFQTSPSTPIHALHFEGNGAGVLRIDRLHTQPIPEPTTTTLTLLTLTTLLFPGRQLT